MARKECEKCDCFQNRGRWKCVGRYLPCLPAANWANTFVYVFVYATVFVSVFEFVSAFVSVFVIETVFVSAFELIVLSVFVSALVT